MAADTNSDELLTELAMFGMRLGLGSIRKLMRHLGDPHLAVPVVLIGGTNGKGSTAALLASMVHAGGYRTGLYTSPHLEDVEERIRLSGRAIPPSHLESILRRVLEASRLTCGHAPTYFEALTAAACCYFQEAQADLAILEVGLGGRLDATNITEPILSLISEISLDHQQHLGESLGAIAREKAGILRPGRPALNWAGKAEKELELAAAEVGVSIQSAQGQVEMVPIATAPETPQQVRLTTPEDSYDLEVSLLGEHQLNNLGLAVRAAETLRHLGWQGLDKQAIREGAASCRWPGRLEIVKLPDRRRVILDAAHNPSGARRLAAFLGEIGKPVGLLFGALDDKNVVGILGPLTDLAEHITLTAPLSERALEPAEVARRLSLPKEGLSLEADLDAALDCALASSSEILVACGSIFLIGPIRQRLRQKFGIPAAARNIDTCGGSALRGGGHTEENPPSGTPLES